MADTTFVDGVITAANKIVSAWLNVINNFVYRGANPLYVTSTGAANTYTITLPATSLLSTTLPAGTQITFKAHQTNTSSVTITLVGGTTFGPTALQVKVAALTGGEILSGTICRIEYDGTVWQLISVSGKTGTGAIVGATAPTITTPTFTAPVLGTIASGNLSAGTGTATSLTAGMATALAGGLAGQVIYQSGANTTSFLTNGIAGTFLRSNGGVAAPTWVAITGGGNALTSNSLAQFATTSSAELAGVISDETGTGNLVFATSPTLVTPNLGVASATSLATSAATPFLLTSGQIVSIALTAQTVGAATLTIPNFANVSDEFTFKTKAQTMSNKTFVAPALGTVASGDLSACTGTAASLTAGVATKATNIAGGAGGSIPYQTGLDTTALLANGTAGQVLQSNGTTLAPSWVAAGGGGNAQTANPLSQFAATTSAQLAGVISDETGTGALVFASSPTLVTPLLGTPTSGTLTTCTGLPISTGVSGLGTNVATFLATPSSANLAAALTDETGSGALVFATSPTLTTPALGTPSSGDLGSCSNYGTIGTPTATTSGTSVTITGIPSTAKRIVICFVGVSTNGSSSPMVQLGNGSPATSGYLSAASQIVGSVNTVNSTTGFLSGNGGNAGYVRNGVMILEYAGSNTWVCNCTLGSSDSAIMYVSAGSKALGGTLDRVILTTVNGTDTFDAGSITVNYF